MKNNTMLRAAAIAAALAGASAAHAQYLPKSWSIGVGVTQVSPHVSSGTLSAPSAPDTRVDIGSNTQPSVWVRAMFDDHWAVEVPIGFGAKNGINGSHAIAGAGRIGTVKSAPVTVFGEYHFGDTTSRIRPYALLGVTYVHMYGARGSAALSAINLANVPGTSTGLSVDSKWGYGAGVGVTFAITDKWYADAQYERVFVKTTAHLSTGQSIDIKLNPDVFRLGVGLRF
jgi:outer membrane protein